MKKTFNSTLNIMGRDIPIKLQSTGDWEIDYINLFNLLEKIFYYDFGMLNHNISDDIAKAAADFIQSEYPDMRLSLCGQMLYDDECED